MDKKKITKPVPEVVPPLLPEISGERQKDWQIFCKQKSIDFGIHLLAHYVPKNIPLLDYCRVSRDIKYITENLKIILHGHN